MNPFFSVIIPTYHRNDALARALDCLAAQDHRDFEVIVSDDGRASTAQELIQTRYPTVQWVQGPQRGPAANRNCGAQRAKGTWLVFTDDDCLPDPQWLSAFAQAVRQYPAFKVFEGRTYADRPRQSLDEEAPINEQGGYLWSCNFAVRQDFFRALGGFDERYPFAFEDVDFRERILLQGEQFKFIPQAAVCHHWRTSDPAKHSRQHFEAVMLFRQLHPHLQQKSSPYSYFFATARSFIKVTLPGVWQYRGRGLKTALLGHMYSLNTAWILLIRSQFKSL